MGSSHIKNFRLLFYDFIDNFRLFKVIIRLHQMINVYIATENNYTRLKNEIPIVIDQIVDQKVHIHVAYMIIYSKFEMKFQKYRSPISPALLLSSPLPLSLSSLKESTQTNWN